MRESVRQFDSTIRCLAERWSGARVLLPGFSLLARGEAITVSQIAVAAGVDKREIEQALETARRAFNENGRLTELFGMMLAPTYHRVEIDGKSVFSCCALWAQVIPKLVDRAVLIESVDPQSRKIVRLEIAPGKVQSVKPKTAHATMALADAASIEQDVGSAFCRHVRHFASPESAHKFAAGAPPSRVVNIDELHEVAGRLHEAILKNSGDFPILHS